MALVPPNGIATCPAICAFSRLGALSSLSKDRWNFSARSPRMIAGGPGKGGIPMNSRVNTVREHVRERLTQLSEFIRERERGAKSSEREREKDTSIGVSDV